MSTLIALFRLWQMTISTGWWGNFTEGEAIALMHKAFDLGITLSMRLILTETD
jgi:hypothetical protein